MRIVIRNGQKTVANYDNVKRVDELPEGRKRIVFADNSTRRIPGNWTIIEKIEVKHNV